MTTAAPKDPNRRFWLTTTAVAGGAGLTAIAIPFVASMAPSERARAIGAPASIDVQGMKLGELRTVEWRGQPVFVLRRSPEMLESLQRHDELLADPQSVRSVQPSYAKNTDRSIRPEFGVLVGICTHLGCIPTFRPTPGAPDIDADWPGAFIARATARNSTWPGGSSRTCPRRPISSFRPTTSALERPC
jgi:ubiquinol-cytochrome c reductase iron-sulfur subunit